MRNSCAALVALQAELRATHTSLTGIIAEMGEPLSGLLRSHLAEGKPLVCAAVVLTAGFTGHARGPGRRHRIQLAVALEMLALALEVHRQLVQAGTEMPGPHPGVDPLNRSFIGSTILTGDYCFSRAAQLAARTENPQVVTVFAQALQDISEGQLRYLFGVETVPFDERRALIIAGACAAVELTTLSAAAKAAVTAAAATLVFASSSSLVWPAVAASLLDSDLTLTQRLRWRAFAAWLNPTHAAEKYPY